MFSNLHFAHLTSGNHPIFDLSQTVPFSVHWRVVKIWFKSNMFFWQSGGWELFFDLWVVLFGSNIGTSTQPFAGMQMEKLLERTTKEGKISFIKSPFFLQREMAPPVIQATGRRYQKQERPLLCFGVETKEQLRPPGGLWSPYTRFGPLVNVPIQV